MTIRQFNKKYSKYLSDGFNGLEIKDKKVIEYLDTIIFPELIKIPEFEYSQIKLKFGTCRFYCEGISMRRQFEIEDYINALLQWKK